MAAVPVWSTKSWYLVDLIRDPDSAIGTTELLVIGAMENLKKAGASQITLGFSPLAKLESMDAAQQNTIYGKCIRLAYATPQFAYGFRSLYDYKAKFLPEIWESKFLIVPTGTSGIREILSIFYAHYPFGLLRFCKGMIVRTLRKIQPVQFLSKQLSKNMVIHSPPVSFEGTLIRCKWTLVLLVMNLYLFVSSIDSNGILRSTMQARYGFSVAGTVKSPLSWDSIQKILISPFLFLDFSHFLFEATATTVLVGILELFLGTKFVLKVYLMSVYGALALSVIAQYCAEIFYETRVGLPPLWSLDASLQIGPGLAAIASLGAVFYLAVGTRAKKALTLFVTIGLSCLLSKHALLPSFLAWTAGYWFAEKSYCQKDPLLFEVLSL